MEEIGVRRKTPMLLIILISLVLITLAIWLLAAIFGLEGENVAEETSTGDSIAPTTPH